MKNEKMKNDKVESIDFKATRGLYQGENDWYCLTYADTITFKNEKKLGRVVVFFIPKKADDVFELSTSRFRISLQGEKREQLKAVIMKEENENLSKTNFSSTPFVETKWQGNELFQVYIQEGFVLTGDVTRSLVGSGIIVKFQTYLRTLRTLESIYNTLKTGGYELIVDNKTLTKEQREEKFIMSLLADNDKLKKYGLMKK